jgi:hypothetical protein
VQSGLTSYHTPPTVTPTVADQVSCSSPLQSHTRSFRQALSPHCRASAPSQPAYSAHPTLPTRNSPSRQHSHFFLQLSFPPTSSCRLALQPMAPPPPSRTDSSDSSSWSSSSSSSASSLTSSSSYRAPFAPLHNPLPEKWAAHLHKVASEYSDRASATLLSSSQPLDKKRANRDLEIAKAMEWLTEHPPLR